MFVFDVFFFSWKQMLCTDLTLLSFMVMSVLDETFSQLRSRALKGFLLFLLPQRGTSRSLSPARYSISRGGGFELETLPFRSSSLRYPDCEQEERMNYNSGVVSAV